MFSLKYFQPKFMSVLKPHPILTTAGHSYDINKMVVQLRMLSGRYRAGCLTKHFSLANTGICELCGLEVKDLAHLLIPWCPHLLERRILLLEYSRTILRETPALSLIFENALAESEQNFVQFLLDLSVRPDVIKNAQSAPFFSRYQELGAIACTEPALSYLELNISSHIICSHTLHLITSWFEHYKRWFQLTDF